MPTIESTQHKLDRVRPPRVQITYDVQVGDAIEQVELPFVLAILADLGKAAPASDQSVLPLKDPVRRFLSIDRDNFNSIMREIAPTLSEFHDAAGKELEVKTLTTLTFTSMDDFSPTSIVEKVPDLKKVLAERQRLRDLQARLDGNDKLAESLDAVVQKTKNSSNGGTSS